MNDAIQIQSEEVLVEPTPTSVEKIDQVNVQFKDMDCEEKAETYSTPSWYKPVGSRTTDINEYLKRPVLIHTITQELGAGLTDTIDPWNLFFNHPSIKRKVDNFSFVRCDLKVKIVVNSSPFYYGCFIAAYKPLQKFGSSFPIPDTGGLSAVYRVAFSQLPHIWIEPQSQKGGTLTLPFLSHTEWLRLEDLDMTNMGTINFHQYVALKNANATAGTSANIKVYCWAENVQLSGLTVDLAMQSDEYSDSPISKPASSIAKASSMLSDLPYIGPFATATSIAANAISKTASLFGYSKVPQIENSKPFKNIPYRSLPTSDISEPTDKLTIDSKNELTIDTRVVGNSEGDQLNINKISQRNSYLTRFDWDASDASDTLIWNSYVTPYLSGLLSQTDQTLVAGTPLWLGAQMFEYWRGDIIFEFKIICSKYHRGRLRFSWDPTGDVANTTNSITEVYTHVHDIGDGDIVSIRVPFTQRTAFLRDPNFITTTLYGDTPLLPVNNDTVNGLLTVRVNTEQTSPVASAQIQVLVFVRGAENIEFAGPRDLSQKLAYFTVQSEEIEEIILGEIVKSDDNLNLVYMGEKVTSYRELLCRANLHSINEFRAYALVNTLEQRVFPRRPIFPGYDTGGTSEALGITSGLSESYNWVKHVPYHLISSCFLGERGSLSWTFDTSSAKPCSVSVSRNQLLLPSGNYDNGESYSWDFESTTISQTSATSSEVMRKTINSNFSSFGESLNHTRTNQGVSINAPMYSQFTMLDTNANTRTQGALKVRTTTDSLQCSILSVLTDEIANDPEYFAVKSYFNVGPDYSLVYFLNVPVLYHYNALPAAVP